MSSFYKKILLLLLALFSFVIILNWSNLNKFYNFYIEFRELYEVDYNQLPSQWMYDQISSDLLPFKRKGIKQITLEKFLRYQNETNPNHSYILYKITPNGYTCSINAKKVLSLDKTYIVTLVMFDFYIKLLVDKRLIERSSSFILDTRDVSSITIFDGKIVPIVTYAKNSNQDGLVLIPDFSTLFKWPTLYKQILEANKANVWEKKKNVVFWRGNTTGGTYDEDSMLTFPRTILVNKGKLNSKINAGFVQYTQTTPEAKDKMEEMFGYSDYVSQAEHLKYKYLINLDGNTCTYPGLLWRLTSNSVVLKQETNNIQWFYKLLVPFQHYVPVKKDLSDLEDRIKWLEANDDKAKLIASSATELVKERAKPSDLAVYLSALLNEYGKLF